MFRNQYDNDIVTWSPQGRIHQIEYAMEAVKQGSCSLGLKSKTHAVLASLKRAPSDMASHQKKIFRIDDHIGIATAGLASDTRVLSRFMRIECINNKYIFDRRLPVSRLVSSVGDKTQVCTQRYGQRPYGVGLVVAGVDEHGPHIYQCCPSANFFDCKAIAIGSRSQSSKTYLERHSEQFPDCSPEELIRHALLALRDSLSSGTELNSKNVSIAVVGPETDFVIYEDEALTPYLGNMETSASIDSAPVAGTEDDTAMVVDDA